MILLRPILNRKYTILIQTTLKNIANNSRMTKGETLILENSMRKCPWLQMEKFKPLFIFAADMGATCTMEPTIEGCTDIEYINQNTTVEKNNISDP